MVSGAQIEAKHYDYSIEDYMKVKESRNFTGKVVLTTGSSSGIGEGIVKLFAILGAHVVVTGRNQTEIDIVAKEVEQLSPHHLKADLTKTSEMQFLLNETIKTYGKLDVLVNNAGIGSIAQLMDKDFMKSYDSVFSIDLRAVVELNRLAVPYLNQTNGTIIHISSMCTHAPNNYGMDYSMAKEAMNMMTRVMAMELGPYIRVNTLSPGAILTASFRDSKVPIIVKIRERALHNAPLKRMGQPLDIAKGVAFLASIDAEFLTGEEIVIDGGLIYNVGVALITGSSSGIGSATALLLAKSGANVVITGRNADNVSKVCKECLKGLKALPVVADVTKEEDLDRLLDTTIKTFSKLDILVNNAGIGFYAPITDADYIPKLKAVFDTNLNSVIYLTHKSIQYLEKTKVNIINISSIADIQSVSIIINSGGISPYHMSKAALDMFTKCIAVDLGPKGIRVNSVNPGAIRTAIIRDSKMTEQQIKSLWERVKSRYPVSRCGEPLDIANTVAYLASDHASFITGTIMVADGGHLAANIRMNFD
ncbi:unnamed protein product, partial [Medioppia subpectinata]